MHIYQEEMTTSGVIIRKAIFIIWDRVSYLNYMDLTNYSILAREQTLSILLSPSPQSCDGRCVPQWVEFICGLWCLNSLASDGNACTLPIEPSPISPVTWICMCKYCEEWHWFHSNRNCMAQLEHSCFCLPSNNNKFPAFRNRGRFKRLLSIL